MAYFDTDSVKFDLNIKGTTFDDQINDNWGPEADEDVDNKIYEEASKARLLTELPVLPLTNPPASIKAASEHFIKERYYKRTKNIDQQAQENEAALQVIDAYIKRLKVDSVFYGRAIR